MADQDTTTKTSLCRRVWLGAMGVALAAGIALNLTALLTVSWLEERNVFYETWVPASYLSDDSTVRYDETNPLTKIQSLYKGMRAGTFQACFTLTDSITTPSVEKTWCIPYRSESTLLYVPPVDDIRHSTFSLQSTSLCELGYSGWSFGGVPDASVLPEFTAKYCEFPGYLPAIFQIGAVPVGLVGTAAWMNIFSSQSRPVYFAVATLASLIGALLSLATIIVWNGAFENRFLTRGVNFSLTIAATVAFAFAGIIAILASRRDAATKNHYVSTQSPA